MKKEEKEEIKMARDDDISYKEDQKSKKFVNLGIVINKKGEILMVRRTKEEIGKKGSILNWAFPGGGQRMGESRSECVRREVLAETGYNVDMV